MELVDTTDLKSVDQVGRAGSIPAPAIKILRRIKMIEFYVIMFFGLVGVAGYAHHMLKMQKEIETLNDRMDAQLRRLQEKE